MTEKEEVKGGVKDGWFKDLNRELVTKEVLLGVTIACAQIPESVAFAFIANVKPPVALHAAWMVGLICSLFGGRPGMVNGATGAFAAIISTFLPEPLEEGGNGVGVELLFPSVMFAGFLMLMFSALDLSRFILLLPSPVMIGFCNGLGLIIGNSQLHPFEHKEGPVLAWMIVITVVSMVVMEFLPKLPFRIFKVIPSSLVAIIVAVVIEFAIVRQFIDGTETIGDVSEFSSETAKPVPFFDYDLDKLSESGAVETIARQGLLLALVGSIESLMTSEVVESFVKTPSSGTKTLAAMGVGNIVSGFFGGMGGNAMIGLSTINVLNGGKTRVAPTVTAMVVMLAVVVAYELLNFIPVAALAGIMFVVVLHTIKWFSLKMLLAFFLPKSYRKKNHKIPRMEVIVIFAVTFLAVWRDIAQAVLAGVALCAVIMAWNSSKTVTVEQTYDADAKVYIVDGPLFFASANRFRKMFTPDSDPDSVKVQFQASCLMDYTAIETLHNLSKDYKALGKTIVFASLNESSKKIVEKASHLVTTIEYDADDIMELPSVPNVAAGFKNDPEGPMPC
mmetsp:Transcript_21604/g.52669  ORF Transcript_21604/g.52669 Transcript_21604/m.52669 type:complete len:561 (+) Transcript_21604:62-1744(+)